MKYTITYLDSSIKHFNQMPFKIVYEGFRLYTLFYDFDGHEVILDCIKCSNGRWITSYPGICMSREMLEDIAFIEGFIRKQKLGKLLK